jgi:hypothetical protein
MFTRHSSRHASLRTLTPSPKLRLDVNGTLVMAIVLALAAPAHVSVPSEASKTNAEIYRAFDANGHSLIHTRPGRGYCWFGSFAIHRRDAWRCATKHVIYDPCFSSPHVQGVILCPDRPPKRTGVRLKLTQPLPVKHANRLPPSLRRHPWALELYDGARCIFETGATERIDGRNANYDCGRGRHVLWGFPSRHVQPWTILSAARNAKTLTHRVTILRAWM